jgi:N utilization substance protein B
MKKKKNKSLKFLRKRLLKAARDLSMRILFAYDFRKEDLFNVLEEFLNTKKFSPDIKEYVLKVVNFYNENSQEVDDIIKSHLKNWRFERIGYIERAVLRLGVSELLIIHSKEENKELKDKEIRILFLDLLDLVECYTNSKLSVKFVNGILGKINKELEQNENSIHIGLTQ